MEFMVVQMYMTLALIIETKWTIFINNIINAQTLGQWIYFREFNIYTNQSILYNNDTQVSIDRNASLNIYNKENPSTDILEIDSTLDIIGQDNIQLGMLNKTYIRILQAS